MDFFKKAVPMNDDLFDFFYEAMPGYEEVGRRRILLGCWGAFNNPRHVDYEYRHMADWGNEMFVTPGVIVDGELVTTNLVDINLGIRILLGSSYYEDWPNEETFVRKDPLGNPVDRRHPWNQTTLPKPQKRDLAGGNYSWVMSPRWYDRRTGDHLALDTGGGAIARLWATALAGKVQTPFVSRPATASDRAAADAEHAGRGLRVEDPAVVERDRARPGAGRTSSPTRPRWRCTSSSRALQEVRSGNTKVFENFDVPDEAIGCGFHEAVRGVLSHHLVIRDKKIANYHPYPPTPWNGSPTDSYGTPGPYEDAVAGQPIFEENGPDDFRGIDIMRAVRSFDPCLPCGVHMYLGNGQTLKPCTRRCSARSRAAERWRSRWTTGPLGDVEALLDRLEALADPAAREAATATVQALLALYGEGLGRIVERVGPAQARALAEDELVAHLLLLHGLHPVTRRAARARGARRRAPVPRLARRRRRAARRRRRRRAAAAAGQLRGLPRVCDDAQARDRGGRAGGRARRRRGRGGGRRRPCARAAPADRVLAGARVGAA